VRRGQDVNDEEPEIGEPIAVIGAGCRFAGGADSPDEFWAMLIDGRDGIGDMPQDRWQVYRELGPDHAAAVRRAGVPGGFLADIEGFDSAFFGLTPREAELMDPQQRILLELTWEALEHAGIPPRSLAGTDAGVFVGIGSDDYGRRMLEDLPSIEAWTGIGSAMCAAANRISYALDLRGPSLAVDTACSASLVAAHLACQSLRAGESEIALVGGINLIISPGLTLTLESAGATAPDGRCKPFDAAANGYGRGEGGGIVVLKRLSTAQRDGDRVLAVIRGSAVNQDGRTNGIMAPNGDAQRELLRETCERAGIAPETVDYVEAHGTGTRLGDPLEAGALSAVYGSGRPASEPCLIGSVKPNIGHLEAGAGIASLIKASLALAHAEIPPSLNYSTGNPLVDWSGCGLRVVTERTPWPQRNRPRRAGISGFGYGGTIGHLLLEQAPEPTPANPPQQDVGQRLFPISAASEAGLRESAGRLADRVAAETAPLDSIGHTLASRRSHLEHRATVVAADHVELEAGLRLVASGESAPAISTGSAAAPGTGLVWVFSGHGSQWIGMGRELLAEEPAFAAALDELEPVFAEEIGFSPRKVLLDGDLGSVDTIQTMIFAMQLGLAAVWRSYGVRPDAVIGHSVGEIAAAVTAGVLTPQNGARLSCRRSRLLRRVAGAGAMAMAGLPFDEVAARLAGRTDVVAAISASPGSTVISGAPEPIEELVASWGAEDVPMRRVASDVAFHSPQMDPLLTDLAAAAADLSPGSARIPWYSTALPDPRTTPDGSGEYWATNLRNPVRLAAATQAAAEDGYRAFLEISAHPVVAHSIGETLAEQGVADAFVGSTLRRNQPESTSLLAAVGSAHCNGIAVDWARLQPSGPLAALPAVAWQRQPHWHESAVGGSGTGLQHEIESHALLGSATGVAGRSAMTLWRTLLDDSCRPYPGSHTIDGTEIVPAAVLLNTFFHADPDGVLPALTEVSLRLPLIVGDRRELQVVRDGAGLCLASRTAEGKWLTHATATASGPGALPGSLPEFTGLAPADPDDVGRHLASVGVPTMAFDWTIEELHRGAGVLRAVVRTDEGASWAPVLDAALSIAPTAHPGPAALRMVAALDEVRTNGTPPSTVEIVVAVAADEVAEVFIADTTGAVVAAISGLRYGGLAETDRRAASPQELVHEINWRPLELTTADADGEILVIGAEALRDDLEAAGARCRWIADPEQLTAAELVEATQVLVATPPDPDVPEGATRAAWLLLRTAQRLAELDLPSPPRLWCITTGVHGGQGAAQLAQSSMWGLGRIIAGEHDELWGGVVDLPADEPAHRVLLDVIRAAPGEDVIAVRDGEPLVARLRRTERESVQGSLTCHADGSYLITGGLGVLGLEIARWLAERGARRLVLAGRRPIPPRSRWDDPVDAETARQLRGIRDLEGMGVTVKVVSLDIADADRAADLLAPDALGLPPIRGVVHAAGVLDNRMLRNVDEESLRTVMRPKVTGAWVLHELFPPGSLDFFVLFSSCGQLLGLPGQATYGAANAFLDALAAHRDDTTSLGWTSWRGQGMAVNEVVDRELRARGITDISVDEAFGAWDLASRLGTGHFAVLGTMPVDADTHRSSLLSELSAAVEAEPAAGSDDGSFRDLPPGQLRERLLEVIGAQIAGEMRMSAALLDARKSLVEQGLDSVMTIVIRRRLEKRFGHKLPSNLLWHQPTVTAIADHLVEHLNTSS
jgi:6-methylsalicylic acid synthase